MQIIPYLTHFGSKNTVSTFWCIFLHAYVEVSWEVKSTVNHY